MREEDTKDRLDMIEENCLNILTRKEKKKRNAKLKKNQRV
jgi:hypothetical protein